MLNIKVQRREWAIARRTMKKMETVAVRALRRSIKDEAHAFKKAVRKAFTTRGRSNGKQWPPNTRLTRIFKTTRRTLVETETLRKSIKVHKVDRDTYFVGIKGGTYADGESVLRIARVHEEGRAFPVIITEKMFRGFMYRLRKATHARKEGSGRFQVGNVIVIRIPQRSFIQATVNAHFHHTQSKPRVQQRMQRYLAKYLALK